MKNGIFIIIDTSNDLAFYFDSRYTKIVTFHVPIKSNEPEKMFMIFRKGENAPEKSMHLNKNHTTRFGISENYTVRFFSLYVQKCEILQFLSDERSRMHVYLFCCFFFVWVCVFSLCQGDHVKQWPYKVRRGLARREIRVLVPHFVTKTIEGQLDSPSTSSAPFSFKVIWSKFWGWYDPESPRRKGT